eukprot:gnl/MRDRNA2_/MRDRNA2_71286_c0_seq2.p1 gnl/MRDRNA2_/MRDRNA2_71286_c0~~gnl/MRDRNA2_/MRDRNA2_71286_c0_seq2.p1  ORF type:complete len:177 (+),score=43.91 gnl/MRDRNA2_/MRDRNA2_71286_c0_seq2:137-667(+)
MCLAKVTEAPKVQLLQVHLDPPEELKPGCHGDEWAATWGSAATVSAEGSHSPVTDAVGTSKISSFRKRDKAAAMVASVAAAAASTPAAMAAAGRKAGYSAAGAPAALVASGRKAGENALEKTAAFKDKAKDRTAAFCKTLKGASSTNRSEVSDGQMESPKFRLSEDKPLIQSDSCQ